MPANSNRALHVTNKNHLKKHFTRWGHGFRALESTPHGLRQSPDSWDARFYGSSTCIRLDQPGRPTGSRPRSRRPRLQRCSFPNRAEPSDRESLESGRLRGSRKGPVRLAATDHSLSGTTGPPYRKRAWLAATLPLVLAWHESSSLVGAMS